MTRDRAEDTELAVVIGLVLIGAGLSECAVPAQAELPPIEAELPPIEAVALDLARVYLAEAGWSAPDHAGIYHALRRRQRGRGDETLSETMRAYSRGLWRGRSARARWILALRPDGTEPAGWPARWSWPRNAPRWRQLLDRARAHLAQAPPVPCLDGTPEHWGGLSLRADRVRAERAVRAGRWRRLTCPGARNAFFQARPQ